MIDREKNGHATLADPRDLLRSVGDTIPGVRSDGPDLIFAPYPFDHADLPAGITARGRDLWKGRKTPIAHEKPGNDIEI